jgi:hypothetical protein
LVRDRVKTYGVSLFKLCQFCDTDYDRIKFWLNARPSSGKGIRASQDDVIKLCSSLGVTVRITMVVSSVDLPDEIKLMNRAPRRFTSNNSVYKKVIEDEFEDE